MRRRIKLEPRHWPRIPSLADVIEYADGATSHCDQADRAGALWRWLDAAADRAEDVIEALYEFDMDDTAERWEILRTRIHAAMGAIVILGVAGKDHDPSSVCLRAESVSVYGAVATVLDEGE